MAIDFSFLKNERLKQLVGLEEGLLNQPKAQGGLLGGLTSNPNLLIGASIIGQGVQGKDPFGSVLPAVTQTAQIQKLLTPKAQKPTAYINKQTGQRELVTPTKYAANPNKYAPLPPTKMFESAEDKIVGTSFGTEFKTLTTDSNKAIANNNNLDLMNELVSLPNIKTGFAGEIRTSVAGLAREFGIETDVQDLTAAEALKGISGKIVLDGLSAFKGAISDGERKFLINITPGLTNSIEGNKLLIQIGKRTNDLGIELANQADQWRQNNGGLSQKNAQGKTWGDYKIAFAKSNPVLNDELRNQILSVSKKIDPDFEKNVITRDGVKYLKVGKEWRTID